MNNDLKNIKRFSDFKPVKKRYKMLNKLYIKGSLDGKFWAKSIDFEIMIVFTVLKNIIVDIILMDGNTSLNDKRFNFDFKIGDSINLAKEWVERNNHTIEAEIKR
jgi:hypothetical protein